MSHLEMEERLQEAEADIKAGRVYTTRLKAVCTSTDSGHAEFKGAAVAESIE